MAATIEGAFVLIDKASSTMARMERQALKTMAAIEGVGAAQDKQSKRGETAARAMGRSSAEMRETETRARGASKEVEHLGRQHEQQARRVGLLERALRNLRGELTKLRGHGGSSGGGLSGLKGMERDLKTAKGALGDFLGSFGVLGSALGAFKLPALGVGLATLVQGVVSLGGAALGALPTLSALGSGMLALPGAAGVAVQGLFSLKAAFAGVMQAVSAGMQAQNQWGLNQREFQQQVTGAIDAVISAHQGLTNAIYNQQQAQISLTVARRDAVRELQDMEFAAQTSVLKEARAGLNIQQAKMELQQAMMTPGTTQLQLQSLRLGVLEAGSAAQQTRVESRRARQDAARARSGDPSSSPVLRVAQAQHAVSQSTIEIANAQRALSRSQQALNFLMSQGNSGVAAYKRQLMGLQPIQRQFVQFLVGKMGPGGGTSLVGQLQALQQAAGQGLFPGLERGVRTAMGAMGMLRTGARQTGNVMGNMGARIAAVFFGRKALAGTRGIMENNVKVMSLASDGFVHFTSILRSLMIAAEPLLRDLARMVDHWLKLKDATYASAKGQASLHEKFRRFQTILREVLTVMHNVHMLFHGIATAAWSFNQTLWHGAERATGSWAKWANSMRGQNSMKRWFEGLLPLLRAIGKLIEALGKGLIGLTSPGANRGTAGLVNGLAKMVPTLQNIILGLEKAFGPPIIAALQTLGQAVAGLVGNSGPFAVFLRIITAVLKALNWLFHLPGVGKTLVTFFAALFAASVIGNYLTKLTGVVIKVGQLRDRWTQAGRAARAAQGEGMGSPGTTGRGRGGRLSRFFGLGGGVGAALQASQSWGVKSGDGPGSVLNPLMVRVEGGLGGGGLPGGLGRGGSAAARELTAAERAAGATSLLARGGRVGLLGRLGFKLAGLPGGSTAVKFLSKIPGLGRLGSGLGAASNIAGAAGAAGETAAVAGETAAAGGLLSKLGPVGKLMGGLGRVLGPIGLGLAALQGVTSFLGTHGNLGERMQSVASSLTFGLIHPGTTNAGQRAQGVRRAQQSFANFRVDPATGLLTAGGFGQARHRQAELHAQIQQTQHPMTTNRFGQQVPGSVDDKKLLDRLAQLKTLNNLLYQEQTKAGDTAAQNWGAAFEAGSSRHGPKWAMKRMLSGLQLQMATLDPNGRKQLAKSMAAWGAQIVQSDPAMRRPVDRLNKWIVRSFQQTGANVAVVNGQILTGSQQEWQQIGHALTDPASKALNQLSGTFGQIQKAAIGSLTAMGFKASDAKALVQGLSGGSIKSAQLQGSQATLSALTNAGVSNASGLLTSALSYTGPHATGGRVLGGNQRDVYGFGNNMLGGGELVMNKHHEQDANARLLRHGEPTVGSIVSSRTTPHWAYASGGRGVGGAVKAGAATRGGGAGGFQIASGTANFNGHPSNVHAGVRQVIATMEHFFPGLSVTATTDGGHVASSYHYKGEAVDLASGDYGYMTRAAEWIKSSGMYHSLTEGIHNPNLAVKYGQLETPPGVFGGVWAGHANHIHLAITGMLGQIAANAVNATGAAGAGGGGGGRATKIGKIKPPRIKGVGGIPQLLAQGAADLMASGMTTALNRKLPSVAGPGGGGGNVNYAGITGGGSSAANQTLGRRMMMRAGWSASQWPSLQALWTQESGWNANAVNPSSGAYGIPQSLGHGHPYNLGDARAQIAWGLNYIRGRYGSPNAAEAHERANNWYAGGGRMANWAGWHRAGGVFRTNGPTIFGAGEGATAETVSIEPANGTSTRPISIHIEKIEVHRKGDIQKIVDEELALLAESLRKH